MKRSYIIFSLLVSITLMGCVKKEKQNERIITVTMEPQRYFTNEIAGDKFSVVSMVPKGSSPESYDPTPSQLVSFSKSEAYLRIGYIGFEQSWFERLVDNAPHILVFDTSVGINLIRDTHHHTHADDGHNHRSSGVDPHIWSSAVNAQQIVTNTCKALCKLDKQNETFYMQRCDKFKKEIKAVDDSIRKILVGADKSFMIYHPALTYFARDYGLHQICIEEGGKEPSPSQLRDLIQTCKKEKVRIIFVQQEFDMNNANVIAKETGTRVVQINPLSYDWKKELIGIAQALKQ